VTTSGNTYEGMLYDPDSGTLVLSKGLGPLIAADRQLDPTFLSQDETVSSLEHENQAPDCEPEKTATEIVSASTEKDDRSTGRAACEISEDRSCAGEARTQREISRRGRPWIPAPPGWISFAILFVIALGYYLFEIDCYRAEFHIVYPPALSHQAEQRVWPLETELRVLESPILAYLVAQDLLAGQSSRSVDGVNGSMAVSYPLGSVEATGPTSAQRFSDSGKFVKWLSSNLAVSPIPAKAMVVVSLTGSDPDFLKAVLGSYVRQYNDYVKQAALKQKSRQDARTVSEQSAEAERGQSGQRWLNTAELQIQELETALSEIGSGKGMFRGFLSEEHLNAVPSLKTLQAKIVDLEIEKIALLDHFSTESREVREKDLQIKKLRNAMQECLAQHLSYLKRKTASLASEKTTIKFEQKDMHQRSGSKDVGTLCTDEVSNEGSRQKNPEYSGLVKAPFIARQPFLVTAVEHLAESFGRASTKGVRVLETKGGPRSDLSSYAKAAGSGLEGK